MKHMNYMGGSEIRAFPCLYQKGKKKAFQTDRRELLADNEAKTREITKSTPIRIITRYGAQWEQIKNILSHHWHILAEAPILGDFVGDRPLLKARRASNLKDKLVHSE